MFHSTLMRLASIQLRTGGWWWSSEIGTTTPASPGGGAGRVTGFLNRNKDKIGAVKELQAALEIEVAKNRMLQRGNVVVPLIIVIAYICITI